MGAPMVLRLLDQGYEVFCWNKEPEKASEVVPAGAKWLDGPHRVREASDIVILCILDGKAVSSVCFGENGMARALGGASLLIDCSTINPDETQDFAARLQAEAGMAWVDAPISGGPKLARDGRLIILAGGDKAKVDQARPVLEDLSANLTHFGALGAGQTAKIINQTIVGVNYVLMAETLVMAEKAGIDPALLPGAFAGGASDSRSLQSIFLQMHHADFDKPNAYARQLDKDLRNVREFAEALDLDLPLLRAAVERYAQFVDEGNGMKDSAFISRFYQARMTGK